MRLEQIKYFVDTAECLSITQAANTNFISSQALSSALLNLEKELEYSLFVRSANKISLSPEGAIFLEYAKQIIQIYNNGISALEAYVQKDKSLSGTIRIYSASNISDLILPDAISYFSFRYPDIKIKLVEIDVDNVMQSLKASSDWDIFFLTATKHYLEKLTDALETRSISQKSLAKDEIILCTNVNSSFAKAKELSNDAITDYVLQKQYNISFYNFIPSNDEPSRIYSCSGSLTTSNNSSLHKMLLRQNIAVTLMPLLSYKYKFQEKDFTYIRLIDANETEHTMLYKSDSLVQLFVDFINFHCAKALHDINGNL
ncbi:MAG: LysR family transcriptional regulator [Peptococcaceae bacterium]|nr:LysR family transcriptional regulator [Peptococcaceae bacterium]MBQ3205776.1 LysR family transcriptional regulator [Peptococcaceae bacterium]MBQ6853520.1 LysR family transcriptional regulator [Peptococcaceae bacterium]